MKRVIPLGVLLALCVGLGFACFKVGYAEGWADAEIAADAKRKADDAARAQGARTIQLRPLDLGPRQPPSKF
jgi:hypothetical protein